MNMYITNLTHVKNRQKLKDVYCLCKLSGHLEKLKIIYFRSKNVITKPSL